MIFLYLGNYVTVTPWHSVMMGDQTTATCECIRKQALSVKETCSLCQDSNYLCTSSDVASLISAVDAAFVSISPTAKGGLLLGDDTSA